MRLRLSKSGAPRPLYALGGGLLFTLCAATAASGDTQHNLPPPQNGGTVIGLCDGKTSIEVQGPMTPEKAKQATAQLMAEWQKKNPRANWEVADNSLSRPPGGGARSGGNLSLAPNASQAQVQNDTYGNYDNRDEMLWAEETKKFIEKGNAIFHDAKQLGGTISVSCDMCHPNGANTHPETYPKYQVQLGRVALLRDMINWCIENPVKGKPLADDNPKLRALEAYILATRKGVRLEYGKH